jgi:hypothetical protein
MIYIKTKNYELKVKDLANGLFCPALAATIVAGYMSLGIGREAGCALGVIFAIVLCIAVEPMRHLWAGALLPIGGILLIAGGAWAAQQVHWLRGGLRELVLLLTAVGGVILYIFSGTILLSLGFAGVFAGSFFLFTFLGACSDALAAKLAFNLFGTGRFNPLHFLKWPIDESMGYIFIVIIITVVVSAIVFLITHTKFNNSILPTLASIVTVFSICLLVIGSGFNTPTGKDILLQIIILCFPLILGCIAGFLLSYLAKIIPRISFAAYILASVMFVVLYL